MIQSGYDIFERDDIKHVRVWGKSEKELFAHALLGIAALLRPDIAPKKGKKVNVRVHLHASQLSDLLEKFAAHVLFEGEMHDAVFSGVDFIVISPVEIECELTGIHIDHKEEEIVEISLGKNRIERFPDRWEAEFIVEPSD